MALVLNGRCLHRPVTGVERYALQLEAALQRLELPFRTITTRHASGFTGHLWEQLVLPLRLRRHDLLLGPANTGPWLLRDQLLVVHDLAWLEHPEWFSGAFGTWYRLLLPSLIPRVRGLITVSRTVADELARQVPSTAQRIQVVPPAVAQDNEPGPAPTGPPLFLFIGPGDPRKEVGIFQRAFALCRERRPEALAVIVGDAGRVFARQDLRPGPGETWTGRVDDDALFALMRRATALVMPSRYEGFGLPILEAMARGCPVIASDLPVFRESFGDAALRVPVGEATTLAGAMTELANDPQSREARVRSGLLRATHYAFDAQDAALHQALRAFAPELSH
ncbi:MAG: glycosyltransferase family 4 protein [Flavobacteriales bacterium]|nr:glycosyltransferase family 4 protein [Flavobacteriales bacterium]